MEKQIARWSYLLGLGSAAIAVIWRALTLLGTVHKDLTAATNGTLTYDSFLKGALLFFVITIASHASAQSQRA